MLTCQICGYSHPITIAKHVRTHDITTVEYKSKYPGCKLVTLDEKARKKISKARKGKKSTQGVSTKTLDQLLAQKRVTNGDKRFMRDDTKEELYKRTPNCTGSIRERIYWLQNNIQSYPLCVTCKKPLKSKDFRNSFYIEHCSRNCAKRDPVLAEKARAKSLKKYGAECYLGSKEARIRIVSTNLERYGSVIPHPWGSEKYREHMVNKHGVECSSHIPGVTEKIFNTLVRKGKWMDPVFLTEFQKYKLDVRRETRKQPTHLLENYEKRGKSKGCYSLDHKYSKFQGFLDGIDTKIIGNIVNLEYIPVSKNCSKSGKCSIEKEELFELFYKYSRLK